MASDRVLHFAEMLLPGGWAHDVCVTIRDGLASVIETKVAPVVSGERHAIGLPGLPNLHSHAFQRGMAGLAEMRGPGDDSFWTWRETMYRFVERIGPDELHAIAALAYLEMLESGFTRVGEFHYLHNDRDGRRFAKPAAMAEAIVAAAAETGIALTHLPVFYAHSAFGGTTPGAGQRRFVHDLDGFAALLEDTRRAIAPLPDAVLGLAPHSLRAVTPGELAALERLAGDGPIHIHVAEQEKEVEDFLDWSGARPVRWLLDHADIGPRWCLVHATHIDASELAGIAAREAVVGLCPITEANLGDGIFPAEAFLRAGGGFGIGSDSNVLIDAAEELRLLEYGQRLRDRGRNRLSDAGGGSTGDALYRSAAAGGAQALGVGAGIAIGHPADIVSLDARHPSLVGRHGPALLDAHIFAARGAIDCVWRRGEKLVSGGRHIARGAVVARYARALEGLLA